MQDPYKALGVTKNSSDADIKKAYRALVKKLHPDLNPSDKKAEERFKEVSVAFGLLGDKDKRAKFDRGEIDASGAETPQQQYYKDYANAAGASQYHSNANYDDMSEMFSDLFGQNQRARQNTGAPRFKMRGGDVRYLLEIEFLDAVNGAKKRITLPDGASLDVKVPAGIDAGQTIRLRAKGQPGLNGGPPGDALIEISVKPHPLFKRDGNDIVLELPITINEAVLGSKIDVPTISGKVRVNIPKGASSGQNLRLKGRGIKHAGKNGDQLCILKIVLPAKIDSELEKFMAEWQKNHPYNPRGKM
ncbi:DnaJ-class molecular chaperone CbpA [hydrothermal vent metagenome]|uniref:DnaJ-class molecular chaperone CbpA n=1 Tax=hydrothermal vent metagenome TaxID=652676 RepID=A0A3B0TTH0_9ZZZZ